MSTEILSDMVDLGMVYLDYTHAPQETTPPVSGDYNYFISTDIEANESDVQSLCGRIGFLEEQSENKWLTTLTRQKISGFIMAASSMAFGIFVVLESANPAIVLITSVAMAILGTWGLYRFISSFFKDDLERSSVRQSLREDLASENFNSIAERFCLDDLIGYDLLKNKSESSQEENKEIYYAKIKAFYRERSVIKINKMQAESKIEALYNKETTFFRYWYSLALQRMNYSWIIKSLKANDKNPREDSCYVNMTKITYLFLKSFISYKFNELMIPWNVWKESEKKLIQSAYVTALNNLDSHFKAL